MYNEDLFYPIGSKRGFWEIAQHLRRRGQNLGDDHAVPGSIEFFRWERIIYETNDWNNGITAAGRRFLREISLTLAPKGADPFVDRRLIKDYNLREGCLIEANIDHGHSGKQVVKQILKICGLEPDAWREMTPFEDKVVVDPQPQLVLEPKEKKYEIPYGTTSIRVIDLICPSASASGPLSSPRPAPENHPPPADRRRHQK